MNKLFMAAALIAAMCGTLMGQSTTPSGTDPGAPQPQAQPAAPQTSPQTKQAPVPSTAAGTAQNKPKIAPGSVIPVQLTKTIDAKKAKTGDQVVAKVTMDMKTQSGDVLVPKDTKVIGHVTEAQPRSKEQKESQLAIAFDHAVTKDGNDMQVPMSIQAIIGQNNNENAPGGNEAAAPPNSSGATGGGGGGKSPMAGNSSAPPSQSQSTPAPSPGDAQTANGGRPPINAQTQGVIGISNLNLAPATNGAQGSVVTSEKNNVKLESGTMLLLKVNQ